MKRFIVLAVLVVLIAGCGKSRESEFAIEESDSETETSTTVESDVDAEPGSEDAENGETTPLPTTTLPELVPDTTGVPTETAMSAAFESSDWEITHGELNDVVGPTIEDDDFSQLVFNGPPAPGFAANVLTQLFVNQVVELELADAGVEVSPENLATSKALLETELNGLVAEDPDAAATVDGFFENEPYLEFLTGFQARQDLLSTTLADGVEPTEQSLPCARHILVETVEEADEIIAELDGDGDFSEIAKEKSLDPGSGANGGELGCADPAGYVPEFKAAIEEAEIGEIVGPVETQFGAHIIVVDSIETSEVPVDGRQLATERLQERLGEIEVEVDPAVGVWDAVSFAIVPAS